MKYSDEFACGHFGDVHVYGEKKKRDYIAEMKFNGLCEDCKREEFLKKLEKEKEEAKKKAQEMQLPELSGTEKQIAWANTIRQKLIDYLIDKIIYIDKEESRFHICEKEDYYFEDMKQINYIEVTELMVNNITKARWYIDNRDSSIVSISKELYKIMQENKPARKIEKQIEKEIETELTAYPEGSEELEPVILTMKENKITAKYSKDDKFKEIIKSLNYSWEWSNYAWELCITSKNGSKEDRAIEAGNKLLNAGFPVKFDTLELKEKSIKAEYKPETTRWIVLMKDNNLGIWFKYRDDKLYKTARTIKSSRWSNPYITVKIEHFNEVLDYAELYNFEIKENAMEEIEKFKKSLENIEKVIPEKKEETRIKKDKLEEILDSDDSILEDLKDD